MLQGNYPTLFKIRNLSFTAPAPKTLENDPGEKGVLQTMLANCRIYAPGLYRLGAKSRADLAGNSSKVCCSSILLRISFHNSLLRPSVEYYRSIVKRKTSIKAFFCVCEGGEY